MVLARDLYLFSQVFPKDETYGLRGQLRRAAVSVPSNIAEGHGRLSDLGFRVFLGQARGSLCEVQTQVMLAADLGYVQPISISPLLDECDEIARMINGLIASLKKAPKKKAAR